MAKPGIAAVAMSGGVDSSVAAVLLKKQGYEVIGLTMRLWGSDDGCGPSSQCCGADDIDDARSVAQHLGIPFYAVNLKNEFRSAVVGRFISEYLEGRTPSPCVVCNRELKFGTLLRKARELGAGVFATGHYARVERAGGVSKLLAGSDPARDQSYFLFSLGQDELSITDFPVGGLSKTEVRRLAAEVGLKVAKKSDSQEVCFVPGDDYAKFIEENAGRADRSGRIVDTEGKVLGRHGGYHRYTVGQRRGLGVAVGRPIYVVHVDPETRDVVVGDKRDLMAGGLMATGARWVVKKPDPDRYYTVRIRSTHKGERARLEVFKQDSFKVSFESPVRAIAPGQAAVVYDGDEVVGGGWIKEALI